MNRAHYFTVFLIHKTVEEPEFHVISKLGYAMPDQNNLPSVRQQILASSKQFQGISVLAAPYQFS